MNRDEVWIHFMAAASASLPTEPKHAAEVARRAAICADYALAEYEKRCVGYDCYGDDIRPHFEPIYSLQSAADHSTTQE